MPLILKPDPTDKTPNRFIVRCDGVQVGRIFDRVPGASAPRNATWCWTIDGNYRRDDAPGCGGDSASREDAMAAFRSAWDAMKRPLLDRSLKIDAELGTSYAKQGCPLMAKDQGIVRDERGQDQPKDKKRAQQPGLKEQREAAENQPQSPGEPAKGE